MVSYIIIFVIFLFSKITKADLRSIQKRGLPISFSGINVFMPEKRLTPLQKIYIQTIIQNPNTSEFTKQQAKRIVFRYYQPWIKKQYEIFCENNRDLLTFVRYNSLHKPLAWSYQTDDLYQDINIGFAKSLVKFNGNCSTLTNYAKPFIMHEIYKGITISTKQMKHLDLDLDLRRCSSDLSHEKHIKISNNLNAIGDILSLLSLEERELICARYDLITMKKIRTIDEICEILGFSHETYRKRYNLIVSKINAVIPERI